MANVVITLKVMLDSPDVDPSTVTEKALAMISEFNGGKETKTSVEPIAFGLKAVNIIFVCDESNGTSDPVEERINALEGVQSVECTDVRRAVG